MPSPYQSAELPLGRGVNRRDAPGAVPAGAVVEARDVAILGRGRIGARKALHRTVQQAGIAWVGGTPFPFGVGVGAVAFGYDAVAGTVSLYTLDNDGATATLKVQVWSGIASTPEVFCAVLNQEVFCAVLVGGAPSGGMAICTPQADGSFTVRTPIFNFASGDTSGAGGSDLTSAMLPRALCQYNNMIFAAGYGTEVDFDRPEAVRFSYLGLTSLGQVEGGDAGADATSENLFDRESYFMVGERGLPVRAMVPALGRLLILTPSPVFVLFGFGSQSFQLDPLDPQHGITAPRAWALAQGVPYWWSPFGPVRYRGSGVEEIGYPLGPDVFGALNAASLVAVHDPVAREVQWWDGTEAWCFNYDVEEWTQRSAPAPITLALGVEEYSISLDGAPVEPQAPNPPSNLATPASGITGTSAVTTWTAGDVTASTLLKRRPTGSSEPWFSVTLEPGITEYQHQNLALATEYDVELSHVKGGLSSATVSGTFTTLASNAPAAPSQLALSTSPTGFVGITLSWRLGQTGVQTEVYRRTSSWAGALPSADELVTTSTLDASSVKDGGLTKGTRYYYRIRSVDAADPTNVSAFNPDGEQSAVADGGIEPG